ncbi:MAG: GNAT family N-acetyltransferase [Chloroflexaceae bacterium]|jgi:GNAT superfamily N-acetyltransferase|nr:GNAT family N-acetyltransferase [Chloroflexaceae bacterium]
MADMLVKLYNLKYDDQGFARLAADRISIKRALSPDKRHIIRFIETSADTHWPDESKESWMSECEAALANNPPTCFIAVKDQSLIGFACYHATAKGYFGPTGVLKEFQKKGIGKALLLKSLLSMWEEGYGYAIIGWPARNVIDFYRNTVQAELIDDSSPGIYRRLISSKM